MNRVRRFAGLSGPLLLGLIILMSGFGIAMIYSAGQVEVRSIATGIWVSLPATSSAAEAISSAIADTLTLRVYPFISVCPV